MKSLLISTCVVTGVLWGSLIAPRVSADTAGLSSTSTGLSGVAAMNNSAFLPNMSGLSAMSLGGLTNCAAQDLSSGLTSLGNSLTGADNATAESSTAGLLPSVLGNQQGGGNGKACSGSDQVQEPQVQCSKDSDSDEAFDRAIAAVTATKTTIQCKEKSVQSIQNELSCFNNAESALAQQIAGIQTAYSQNIQRFNQDVGTYNSLIQDRQQQSSEVAQKLGKSGGGDSGGGGSGLLGIQAQLTAAVNATIPGQVLAVTNGQTKIQQDTASFNQAVTNEEIQLTQQCFTTNATFSCKNGPCSAEAYLLERLGENQLINGNGVQDPGDAILAYNSQQNVSQLQTVLNALFGNMATQAQYTLDQNQAAQANTNALNSNATIFTPSQIQQSPYWAQLQAFNNMCTNKSACLNVSGFVLNQMQNCYNQSISTVNTDKVTPGRGLYQQIQAITQETTQLKTTIMTDLQPDTQLYTQAMAAMTGAHYPLSLTACQAASTTNAVKCLTDMQSVEQDLLNGYSSASEVTIPINGRNSANNVTVNCYGVNGCVTALTTLGTNLQAEINTQTQNKNDYINQANQAIQNTTNTFISQLSTQSAYLNNQLKMINNTLAADGIASIDLKPIKSAQLKKSCGGSSSSGYSDNSGYGTAPSADGSGGSNCIFDAPTNLMNIIGGNLNPPLVDLSGSSNAGTQEISDFVTKEQRNLAKATEELNTLTSEKASCDASGRKDDLKKAKADVESVVDNCTNYPLVCLAMNQKKSFLTSLIGSMQQLNSLSSDAVDVSNFSNTGINCSLDGGKVVPQGTICDAPPGYQQQQASPGGDGQYYCFNPPGTGQNTNSNKCQSSVNSAKSSVSNAIDDYTPAAAPADSPPPAE